MNNRAGNKILSFALAAVMLLGLFASGPAVTTAYAAAGDPSDGVDFSGTWAGTGGSHKSYYFGTYNNAPILWRRLEGSSSEVFLFSEKSLANKAFRDNMNVWAYSDIRAYLNDETAVGFIEKLPQEIQTALQTTPITEKGISSNDKAYLLSANEADSLLTQAERATDRLWWLRSPGSNDYGAAVVSDDGSVYANGDVDNNYAVRPALKIDQSSEIFTSDGGGTGQEANPYTLGGSPIRVVKDEYVRFPVNSVSITWKVLDVDATGDIVTLFPTTTIGQDMAFKAYPWNKWSESTVRRFLNPDNGIYEQNTFAFAAGEAPAMRITDIEETGDIQMNETMFLLSTSEAGNGSYFSGDSDRNINTFWWLRSPGYSDSNAAVVANHGDVDTGGGIVNRDYGVRPAFKLNPSSVIFASEIVSSGGDGMGTINTDSNYSAAAGGGAKNYKLTVLGGNGGADVGTLNGVPTAAQYTTGGSLALTGLNASQSGGNYSINYKIVGGSGSRTIEGYGYTAASNSSLTINTSALTLGETYDVYVWLQKNNAANSNEATNPAHFTLSMTTPGSSGSGKGSSSGSSAPQTPPYKMITIKDQSGKTIGSKDTTGKVSGGIMPIKPDSQSDGFGFSFNLLNLSELEKANQGGKFVITLPGMEYEMPFNMMGIITGLADFLEGADLKDYTLDLTIKKLTGDELAKAQEAFKEAYPDGELPADFYDISFTLYRNGSKVDFDANSFDSAMMFSLTTTKKCNAVFKYDPLTGRFSFVPATFGDTKAAVRTRTHSIYIAAYNNVTFPDVKTGAWYEPFVKGAANKGLIAGYQGLFRPEAEVTRAEFTQMMVNAIQLPAAKEDTKEYSDVTSGNAWYYDTVMRARSAGLLDGFTDADFKPNQAITREEMASVLAAVLRQSDGQATMQMIYLDQVFTDYDSMDQDHLSDIELVYRTGLMSGTGEGKFSPNGVTTRAQAATVQIHLLEILGLID